MISLLFATLPVETPCFLVPFSDEFVFVKFFLKHVFYSIIVKLCVINTVFLVILVVLLLSLPLFCCDWYDVVIIDIMLLSLMLCYSHRISHTLSLHLSCSSNWSHVSCHVPMVLFVKMSVINIVLVVMLLVLLLSLPLFCYHWYYVVIIDVILLSLILCCCHGCYVIVIGFVMYIQVKPCFLPCFLWYYLSKSVLLI